MSVKSVPVKRAVKLCDIRLDGDTQARAELNNGAVQEYYEAMLAYQEFPRVVVFFDGSDYWLADGFHRFHAFKRTQYADSMECDVHTGGKRDALLFAVGANRGHGLRRTNDDKRRAVAILLGDEEWCQRSDMWIAEHAAVSQPFVGSMRKSLITVISDPSAKTGKDGRTQTRCSKPTPKADAAKPASQASTPTSSAPKAKPETNVIGDLQSRVSSFINGLLQGHPSHVAMAMGDYLERLAQELRA